MRTLLRLDPDDGLLVALFIAAVLILRFCKW